MDGQASSKKQKMEEYVAMANQVAENITKKEDQEYFISELNSIKLGSRS
jgi:hypothetical protein